MSVMRVFSGSCLSLDDHDYSLPRMTARKHVLGSGEDLFDDQGRPRQPQPRTMTKVFSGSALDLNAGGESETDSPANGVSPSAGAADHVMDTTRSFNDFVDRSGQRQSAASRPMVLVIGGSGYLASHVIEQLLREGFQVRATVPDIRNVVKLQDLYGILPEAKHMLYVVEADVFSSASLRNAMTNCRYIIHCGVPSNPSIDVVQAHVKAVMALFDALSSRKVDRVVLTGSYTNVLSSTKSKAPTTSGLYDETQWNDSVRRELEPLTYARVQFESEAIRLSKLANVELVTVLPAIMIGPTRTLEVSEAMRTINEFALASPYFPIAPDISWNFVDVRDVAQAHVRAMTARGVAGSRFIVTNSCLRLGDLGRHIRGEFPHLTSPIYTAPTIVSLAIGPWGASFRFLWRTLGVRRVLDGSKAQRELALELRPISETVHDAVADLILNGHLPSAEGATVRSRSAAAPMILGALALSGVAVAFWLRSRK